jgi:probable phosphoglycerate mutase
VAEIRRLVLVRHGRTAWNAIDRAQGHTDVQLDDCGREQSRDAAVCLATLSPTRIWTSDLARARESAQMIGEAARLVPETDPRLREFDVGVRSGLTRPEFAERYPEEYAAWLAGAPGPLVEGEETADAVRARVGPALSEALESLSFGQTGLVVMHGASLKVGMFALLGWPWASGRTLRGLDNGAWAVLEQRHHDPTPRLAGYNLTAHRRAASPDFARAEPQG